MLPGGWGAKSEDIDDDDWEADDSEGQWICAELNLGRGCPIMYNSAGLTYMFEAGKKVLLLVLP